MSHKPYFPSNDGDPAPLAATVKRFVRFEELDPLGIVWHGRYASFFEDARVALGAIYGVGYEEFQRHGVVAPIKILHIDYLLPLAFNDEIRIDAVLHWSPAARLNYTYAIWNSRNEMVTTGYSVQLFLDRNQQLMVCPPDFIVAFLDKWRHGTLTT